MRRLLTELWGARSLIRVLSRRDFYVRYRRASLGIVWALAVPLIQAAVLAVIFTRVVRVQTDIPYAVFILAGVLPWTFFSLTLGDCTRSITAGSQIASKVYFPRAVLPLVKVGAGLYGFMPTIGVLILALFIFGVPIGPQILYLVPAVIVMVALTVAFALVIAALQVYFRDVAYIFSALMRAWFYASAVFFPVSLVPEGPLRTAVILNPATGLVDFFRVAVSGFEPHSVPALISTLVWTVVLLVAALLLYRRFDRVFVDLL